MSNITSSLFSPSFIGPDYIQAITQAANGEIRRNAANRISNNVPEPELISQFRRAAKSITGSLPLELVYISDNGHTGATEQPVADQAADEIKGRLATIARAYEILAGGKPNIAVRYQDVASQDTIGGAAALTQAVRGEVPVFGRFVFLNVAPRKEERGIKADNGGEDVYIGIHKNGTFFGGTGAHCFSLFKDDVEKGDLLLVKASVATAGSQFRSRDFFPWLAYVAASHLPQFAHLAGETLDTQAQGAVLKTLPFVDTKAPLKASAIPDLPNNGAVVTSIDVHGNLKTALTGRDLDKAFPNGGAVEVLVNGQLLPAEISSASFDKAEGRVALSRGSTYRDPLNLGDSRPAAVEIFKVGGRVADDIAVGAPHLRRGLTFDVIDGALFTRALDAVYGAHKTSSEQKKDLAQSLVAQGLVKGLDNSGLRNALEHNLPLTPSRSGISAPTAQHQHLDS